MEIGPITGIRPFPTSRFKERETEMPAVFEVEYLGRTGDESYSPNHGDGTPGQDGDGAHADGSEPDLSSGPSADVTQLNQVSFFA